MVTRKPLDQFYVYHNWQAGPSKAVIHRGSCGHCKNGQGWAGDDDPKDARWHGPFTPFQAAHDFAAQLDTETASRRCRCM